MSFYKYVGLLLIFSFLYSCKQSVRELPFYIDTTYTPRWIKQSDQGYNSIPQIGSFQFTNQFGASVTNETVRGKVYLADFFFTTCPSICPMMTDNMQTIQEAMTEHEDFLLLSHSVMPWVDSVPVLLEYANLHEAIKGKWHFLNGDADTTYSLARKSYLADEEFGYTNEELDFLHTDKFVLVDRKQRVRGIYSGIIQENIERIISDAEQLLLE